MKLSVSLLIVGLLTQLFAASQSETPNRWEYNSQETREIPPSVLAALIKYQSEYAKPRGIQTQQILNGIYQGDMGLLLRLAPLGGDAILPIGDAMIAATREIDKEKRWMQENNALASKALWNKAQERINGSQRVLLAGTTALGKICDRRALVVLKLLERPFDLGETGTACGAAFKKETEKDPDAQYLYGFYLMSKAQSSADGKVTAVPGTLEAFQKYLELRPNGRWAASAKGNIQTITGKVAPTEKE